MEYIQHEHRISPVLFHQQRVSRQYRYIRVYLHSLITYIYWNILPLLYLIIDILDYSSILYKYVQTAFISYLHCWIIDILEDNSILEVQIYNSIPPLLVYGYIIYIVYLQSPFFDFRYVFGLSPSIWEFHSLISDMFLDYVYQYGSSILRVYINYNIPLFLENVIKYEYKFIKKYTSILGVYISGLCHET